MLNWTGEKPIENEWESEAPAELSTHLPSYLRNGSAGASPSLQGLEAVPNWEHDLRGNRRKEIQTLGVH